MSVIAFPADRLHGRREARRTNHPSVYDQAADTSTTQLLFVTPIEANIIRTALAASSATAARDLAVKVEAQITVRHADDCNPHGMPRPS